MKNSDPFSMKITPVLWQVTLSHQPLIKSKKSKKKTKIKIILETQKFHKIFHKNDANFENCAVFKTRNGEEEIKWKKKTFQVKFLEQSSFHTCLIRKYSFF